MTSNSTINIISDFLSNHNIELNVDDYVYKKVSLGNLINQNIANDIIELIICDSYEVTSPYLKKISNVLFNGFGIHINSNQKNILKKYLIYNLKNDMDVLLESIINHNLKSTNKTDDLFSNNFGKKEFINVCKKIMTTQFNIDKKEAVQKYIYNLNKAISNNNENRIKDYITFLYSRLLGLNELKELSLYDLFILNQDKLIKELSDKEFNLIKKHCANKDKLDRNQAVNLFNQYYLNIIDKNQENPCSLFYLYLNQNLFNEFDNEKSFINYILEIIKQSYIQIQNHKTLSIHISNIINNEGINIKWKLYSFISIFAEKFISYEEKRPYYHPAKICFNILKYQFDDTADITLDMLEEYYKNDDVNVLDVSKDILKTIDYCKNIYTGFTFLDCIVLDQSTILENSTELDCINNKNELLLVFSKNEIDDRKIPCPKCASITISGNSFPEIGIRSWECKNSLCPSRSKTNRGKRYSRKNIYMQSSNSDFSMENIINKNIIKKWRRDIVKDFTDEDLYTMLIKYFTYSGDSITALNSNNIHQHHQKNLFELTFQKACNILQ